MSCAIHREEAANSTLYILLNTTSNIEKNPCYFYYLFSDKMLKILKLQLSTWNLVSNCLK